jgi:hypothetical protein
VSRSGIAWRRVATHRSEGIPAYRILNREGTHDSLCLRCFWTAAIGMRDFDIAEAEMKHVCGQVPALLGLPRQGLHTHPLIF